MLANRTFASKEVKFSFSLLNPKVIEGRLGQKQRNWGSMVASKQQIIASCLEWM